MRGDYGRIVTLPLHEYISQYSRETDLGGGRRRRKAGDICGVLLNHVEISGVNSEQVTRKCTQPWKNQVELHVQTLEF